MAEGDRRTGVAAEGNARCDRCGTQGETSDVAENTEIANENVVGEVGDQICPGRPFRLRESVHLVDENADADPLQRLPGAVEDDERQKRDPANSGSVPSTPRKSR